MKAIKCASWDEFQRRIDLLLNAPKPASGGHVSEWLFRGHSNAKWGLTTTLERRVRNEVGLVEYYRAINAAHPEIESRTGRRWSIPVFPNYYQACQDLKLAGCRYPTFDESDLYEYLVYLRHHGFPSPLLDWTASPYIAAYFAFRDAIPTRNVAIFAYREYAGNCKMIGGQGPRIQCLGPYVRSHERHFQQLSQYTVCFDPTGHARYMPHETALSGMDDSQDQLRKVILPGKLRLEVLRYLMRHNVTALSLFGSPKSLMETMAIREFDFDG